MLKQIVGGAWMGLCLLALHKWTHNTKKAVHVIRIKPTIANVKIMPSRAEWMAFFKRPIWKSMLSHAVDAIAIRSVGCTGIHGHTGCVYIDIRLKKATDMDKEQMAFVRDAFHEATHAGDPVRVQHSGNWHTCWFKYDDIDFISAPG